MSLSSRSKRSDRSINMIKNKISILEIKNFFKKNGLVINKKKKAIQSTLILEIKNFIKEKGYIINKKKIVKLPSDFRSLTPTLLISIIIISIFTILPLAIDLTKQSRIASIDLKDISEKKTRRLIENQETESDQIFLFEDILEFDEQPTDNVRLSASTIEELFKSTNYNLDDVRKNKLVKPITLTLLPKEIKQIENTKKRKDLFIQIILPLVIKENNKIKVDRKRLFSILNKNQNSKAESSWLNLKFKQYGVVNKDLSTLKIRMDEIPVSMAIAQAAKETGWGTSRFAQEGNALFGQWTWTGEGIKPAEADVDSTHKVMKFIVLQASVRAYQRNLNTHSTYRDFRSARAALRDEGKILDSKTLTEHLNKYAETGKKYVKTLQQIIRQNHLEDFDDAKLLPSSIDLESLI
jgi:Bax protein